MGSPKKIWKVRHKETGKFLSGTGINPKWTNKGRTWDNWSHFMNFAHHIPSASDISKWEILEYIVEPTHNQTLDMSDVLKFIHNKKHIEQTYGWQVREIIDRLENNGHLETYPFILFAPTWRGEAMRVISQIKSDLKIPKSDYRHNTYCVAFRNQKDAMRFKLMHGETFSKGIDTRTMEEIDAELSGKVKSLT